MEGSAPQINATLAQKLISVQFPKWSHLPVFPVSHSGWDNRTFHLGDNLLIRLPSHSSYAPQITKEQTWLSRLAPALSLIIPSPIAMGVPTEDYLWNWSVYEWIAGEDLTRVRSPNKNEIAADLANFITEMHTITAPEDAPKPSQENFYRGGDIRVYEQEFKQAIQMLGHLVPVEDALELWQTATVTSWKPKPVWVHGDLSPGNLIISQGSLAAVIDFGMLCVGDPACDLGIAWTYFEGNSREIFQDSLDIDKQTWLRSLAWVLWKAAILGSGMSSTADTSQEQATEFLKSLLGDSDSLQKLITR